MIHQELLRRALTTHHPALQDFVETLAPTLLVQFSGVPALGGAADAMFDEDEMVLPPEAVPLTQRDRETFSRTGYDQSLAAHVFNGIFAGARIADMLTGDQELRDEEWRIWILGFVVHDYTKDHHMQMRAEYIPAIRDVIAQDGERLHFDAFFPAWRDYLDDIVFVAQNAQTMKSANLDMHLFPNLRLRWRRRERLRMLASFADVLVHIHRPSDVAERGSDGRDRAGNLRKKLAWLFDADTPPRLAYHRLSEVRGLTSNVINNALMRVLEAQGYQPYLFFPDGVVYLVAEGQQATIDSEALLDSLWSEIGTTLAGIGGSNETPETHEEEDEEHEEEEEREGGLRITRAKDYLKVPPVLYELLSFEQVLTAARSVALNIAPSQAKTAARLGSELAEDQGIKVNGTTAEKQKRFVEIGQEFAKNEDLPVDVRVDRIAEFCAFVHRRLKGIFPKAEWLPPLLLDVIDVKDCMPVDRVYRNNGGTPTGWFYAASHYVRKHPDLDDYAVEALLIQLQAHVLDTLRANMPNAKSSAKEQAWYQSYQRFITEPDGDAATYGRFETAFRDYARSIITVDGQPLALAAPLDRFARELQQYTERKATNKVQCSLCSSPYEARQQDKSEVLFKPQQYSNKNRLDTGVVKRGICPICAIEMMLRQVQQGMRAGSAQDEKPICVYLYPTYFFTTETAKVMHEFINQLRDLSLPDLLRHVGRNGFTLEALANYDLFVADDQNDTNKRTHTLNKPTFSDRDPASLFFFSLRAPMEKKKLTDTDAWIEPVFYALALPLLLDIKVVVSQSFMPLYNSGADFRETSMLDAPHGFTKYILDHEQLRVNELKPALWKLLRLYELHLDVFKEPNSGKREDMHFSMLNGVAKDIATDPLYVFSYYERKQRKPQDNAPKANKAKAKAKAKKGASETFSGDGIPPFDVERYMAIYKELKTRRNDPMSFIAQLVDDYAEFYRADYNHLGSTYTVIRPLGTAIDVTKNSSPETCEEDLILIIAGAINDEMNRVRDDPATSGGYDPIKYGKNRGTQAERLEQSMHAIEHFVRQFVQLCFNEYCKGDRGILRERANRLRSAARFYYLSQPYARRLNGGNSQTASTSAPKE